MSKKVTIILIVVVVIIAVLGVGGYFAVKKVIQIGQEKGWKLIEDLVKKGENGKSIFDKLPLGEEEEEEEEDVYKSAKEVKASGLAKEINPELKPIFTEVFGGVKLTSFTSGFVGPGSAILVYTVKKDLKAEDSGALISVLEGKNYTIQGHTISDGQASIIALKDDLQLVIGYEDGQQEISIMAYKED